MADFIEGKRPVIEALRTGVPIKSILMADNVQRDGLIEDILRKAKRARTYQGLADELADLSLSLAVDDLRTLRRGWDDALARERALEITNCFKGSHIFSTGKDILFCH